MSLLYLTADKIGDWTGGGQVTEHESYALYQLGQQLMAERRDPTMGQVAILGREQLAGPGNDVWKWDEQAAQLVGSPRLCHIYAGTWPKTAALLKQRGCKLVVTIAAHDKDVSRKEHEDLGLQFPYPHLTRFEKWQRYISGYALADVIVCPGKCAAAIVRNYGTQFANKRIEIIPHGCNLPEKVTPPPKRFVVGYLGSFGPDKGVKYLLQAWKQLGYEDGSLLVLAGKDSQQPWAAQMVRELGGGNVHLLGWQDDIAKFYNQISLFCCPAATEGFNIEVLEAMAHGRPTLCSMAAGAADLVSYDCRFAPRDANALATHLDWAKKAISDTGESWTTLYPDFLRSQAKKYTWDNIRLAYQQVWRSLL